jgi:hypothetical protein
MEGVKELLSVALAPSRLPHEIKLTQLPQEGFIITIHFKGDPSAPDAWLEKVIGGMDGLESLDQELFRLSWRWLILEGDTFDLDHAFNRWVVADKPSRVTIKEPDFPTYAVDSSKGLKFWVLHAQTEQEAVIARLVAEQDRPALQERFHKLLAYIDDSAKAGHHDKIKSLYKSLGQALTNWEEARKLAWNDGQLCINSLRDIVASITMTTISAEAELAEVTNHLSLAQVQEKLYELECDCFGAMGGARLGQYLRTIPRPHHYLLGTEAVRDRLKSAYHLVDLIRTAIETHSATSQARISRALNILTVWGVLVSAIGLAMTLDNRANTLPGWSWPSHPLQFAAGLTLLLAALLVVRTMLGWRSGGTAIRGRQRKVARAIVRKRLEDLAGRSSSGDGKVPVHEPHWKRLLEASCARQLQERVPREEVSLHLLDSRDS